MINVAITALYAGILALILIALSLRVIVVARARANVVYGDGGQAALTPVVRAQGNFTEYVPFALLLMGFLEATGSSANLIHGLGIALVIARILHPLGLRATSGPTFARVVGTVTTLGVLGVAAVFAIMRFLSGGMPGA